MLENIHDIVQKFGTKNVIFGVTVIATLGIVGFKGCISANSNSSHAKPADSSIQEKDNSNKSGSSYEIPEVTGNAPQEDDTSTDLNPATPDSTETIQANVEDDPIKTIIHYLEETGDYYDFVEDDTGWDIKDYSEYADEDEKFKNLVSYNGIGKYTHDIDYMLGDTEATHKKDSEADITVFATKNEDGSLTIHYASTTSALILNDGYLSWDEFEALGSK